MLRYNRRKDLEAKLRAERPQPSAELLASIEDRVRFERQRSRGRRLRLAFVGGLTAAMLAALAVVGGIGQAATGVSDLTQAVGVLVGLNQTATSTDNPAGDQYGHKILMCHNGHEIFVDASSVQSHLQHGDTLGPCP